MKRGKSVIPHRRHCRRQPATPMWWRLGGGRTIYVSGQVPLDSEGRLVGEGDLPAQAEQVFHNIRLALEHAGASFADVVKLVFYMTDISLIKDVRVIRDRYIDTENPPASSAVEVRRLFRDDIQIEVEAIAVTE